MAGKHKTKVTQPVSKTVSIANWELVAILGTHGHTDTQHWTIIILYR